ncbi:MAG: hypothetical protein AAGA05_05990 [Pseudomonadota bacterium]
MRISLDASALTWAIALTFLTVSHSTAEEPLSVIDWLSQAPEDGDVQTVLLEPPVSESALYPVISVAPLDTAVAPIGLVPAARTGLPAAIFQRSDPDVLIGLIDRVPVQNSPAMQSLLYTVLLSETLPPQDPGAAAGLLRARIDRLSRLGAVDPALAMAELAGARNDADLFQRWFDASLLTGEEDPACAVLNRSPALSDDYAARIFCAARAGDWPQAELLRVGATAVGALDGDQADLVDRFLHPEFFEDAPLLPEPDAPDPLTFRLFEAIGERLPTAPLPRAFANADLRDVAGWKAQIEAAERLVRSGALSGNRLLGLYTERRPAASGGVWDRVSALQKFETALDRGDPTAVAQGLPAVWNAMEAAGTEVAFAELFADRLAEIALEDTAAQDQVFRIGLLSSGYNDTTAIGPMQDDDTRFLLALATSQPDPATAPDAQARAIADGFASYAAVPEDLQQLLDDDQLGEVILRAIILFDQGGRGNLADLTQALATFRAIGLDDTARRAALQLRLLRRT